MAKTACELTNACMEDPECPELATCLQIQQYDKEQEDRGK
jgi:hypothetical protein